MPTANCHSRGIDDVTACLQTAIDNTPPGGVLFLPENDDPYLISAPLRVDKPMSIIGEPTIIEQRTAGQGGIEITSSGVTLANLTLVGPQFAVQTPAEKAITAIGPDGARPLQDISVKGCVLDGWGMYGFYGLFIHRFVLEHNIIQNINYAGVMGLSASNGEVAGNYVNNIVGSPNAYGIIMTRLTTNAGELAFYPRTRDVLITGNRVENVLNWEGIDTHAGLRITITNNRLLGCRRGITLVDCPNAANVTTYAPQDCVVIGNVMDSGVTDGSAVYGIVLQGASVAVGPSRELAGDCVIQGNIVRGYGDQANALGMAMLIASTRAAVINGNTIIEPGKMGIGLYLNNYGFACNGNAIVDPWSLTQQSSGINLVSNFNRGSMVGNVTARGGKVAPHVLEIGVAIGNFSNNYVNLAGNYSDSAFPVYDPGSHGH